MNLTWFCLFVKLISCATEEILVLTYSDFLLFSGYKFDVAYHEFVRCFLGSLTGSCMQEGGSEDRGDLCMFERSKRA